jgi:Uma2 family endonuclease
MAEKPLREIFCKNANLESKYFHLLVKMISQTRIIPQSAPPLSPRQTLPSMYDLPSENVEEPGLPDEFHGWQAQILQLTFKPRHWKPDEVFSAMDINLYYDVKNPLWYKRPDWFGVVGVSRLYDNQDLRLSYVIWQEQLSPLVVVELLSPGTEEEDLGKTKAEAEKPPTKWQVYEQILRVPYYVVFSRYTDTMQAFRLEGDRYQEVALTEGRLLIPSIELSLGLWQGSYENIERLWLRWMTLAGDLIPLPTEKATAAEQRATAAEQRAARLAAQLKELGVELDDLD